MKHIIGLLLLAGAISTASAKTLLVGVSPYWDQANHKTQFAKVMKFATKLNAGDELVLIDAFHQKPLGTFTIPEGSAYRSPKARIHKNGKLVASFKKLSQNPDGVTRVNGAIKLPHFFHHVSEFYADTADKTMVVIGSPIFDDLQEPSYSMRDGFFPNDTHITASKTHTIYGAKGLGQSLSNWQVHFAHLENQSLNSRHDLYVKRFWTLFTQAHGATLASYTTNVDMALKRARQGAKPAPHEFTLDPQPTMNMMRMRISDSQVPIHSRTLADEAPSAQTLHQAKHVQISAIWDCECDVDLYARGNTQGDIISFQNTSTFEGWYFKDIQGNSKTKRVYETIEFFRPVDLHQMQIALVFYRGNAPKGVSGSIRLAIDDKTYAYPFHIPATIGMGVNTVKQSFKTGQSQAKHIVMINPLDIVAKD